MSIVVQFIFVYGYLSVPRAILTAIDPGSDLGVTRGWLDRRLAYAAILLAAYHIARPASPKWSPRLLIGFLHLEFLLGAIEAGAVYFVRVGYSPLFFYHLDGHALYVAAVEHWLAALGTIATVIGAQVLFRWTFTGATPNVTSRGGRAALVLLILFSIRSVDILRRHGVPAEFPLYELAHEWNAYRAHRTALRAVALTPDEYHHLSSFGIAAPTPDPPESVPGHRLNLITIYVEGLQANLVDASAQPQLTPALSAFAATGTQFTNFFNAVTPTINALVSSQCGALIQVENDTLESDRGLTGDLQCLSDRLHDAGYYQVFMGGADRRFSGKDRFLTAHRFDEVWGWREWRTQLGADASARNEWGLNDDALFQYAIRRLPDLAMRRPFHLALLTLNTHAPGFVTPQCPQTPAGTPRLLRALRCTDAAIGRLLDALEAGGYLQDSVVAIMGDHTMFPTPDNAAALKSKTVGWYGRVFMAIRYPGATSRTISTPSYTPDLAPIAMEAMGFQSADPLFVAGRSSLLHPADRTALLAPQFQIVDDAMIPAHPTVTDDCPLGLPAQTTVDFSDGVSACERKRLVTASQLLTPMFASGLPAD